MYVGDVPAQRRGRNRGSDPSLPWAAWVFNGKHTDTVFPEVRGTRISMAIVQRIARQVEAKCREFALRTYGDPI